jgi:hypothetical protein
LFNIVENSHYLIFMDQTAKKKKDYQRTIDEGLLNAWHQFRRRGDGGAISEELGYSRPVIDRALIYGYVKTAGLAERITEFFQKRLNSEKSMAQDLVKSAPQPQTV